MWGDIDRKSETSFIKPKVLKSTINWAYQGKKMIYVGFFFCFFLKTQKHLFGDHCEKSENDCDLLALQPADVEKLKPTEENQHSSVCFVLFTPSHVL